MILNDGAYQRATAGLLVLIFCVLSIQRNQAWRHEAVFLEDIIRKSPGKPRAYYNLGCVYGSLHRYGDAADMLTRSIALYHLYNGADNERSREFHFHAYMNRGAAHAGMNRLDEAIEDFTKVISLKPETVVAYLARGDCYLGKGDMMQAEQDYRKACERDDEDGCANMRASGARQAPDAVDRYAE